MHNLFSIVHLPLYLTTPLKDFQSQDFKHFPFLTYIYVTYIILTEIIIIFNCYEVTATQLTTFIPLYSYNNITLKMAALAAAACW
jgi:hypothetical protein